MNAHPNRWKKAGRCAGFLCVLGLLLFLLTPVLREKNHEFLSPVWNDLPGDQCDVVLIGPSTIMNAVYPLQLWHEEGISAYNYATGAQSFMATCYLLTEILKKQSPSLVVLDCGRARSARAMVKIANLHYLTDRMPLFMRSRLEMIRVTAKDRGYTFDEVMGLLFPLYAYHGRWSSVTEKDFDEDYKTITFGAKIDDRTQSQAEAFADYEADPEYSLPDMSETWLRKVIALCEERDIPLLLVTMPNMIVAHDVNQSEYELRIDAAAAVDRIAEEEGLTHLNLIKKGEEIGLVPDEDTGDGQHLNYKGAEKFTAWIGAYIREHYVVPDRREDADFRYLDEKYDKFASFLETMIG